MSRFTPIQNWRKINIVHVARMRMTRNAARVLVGTAFVNCTAGRLSTGKNHICMDLEDGSN
jgi:hypothetical protein